MSECDTRLRSAAIRRVNETSSMRAEEIVLTELEKTSEVAEIALMACSLLNELLPSIGNNHASLERILTASLKFLKLHVRLAKAICILASEYALPKPFLDLLSSLKNGLAVSLRGRFLEVSLSMNLNKLLYTV